MSLFSEYKSSLKAVEVEEIFDLILYRPLAFLFVKATYSINLTPDRVSVAALLVGSTAGIMFGLGAFTFLAIGAVLYFTSNVLDCADGQIARLKKNGTKVGRIVDGVVDYVVSTFVFFGITIGLTSQYHAHNVNLWGNSLLMWNPVTYIWVIGILGGISSAAQAFYFDFYRNKFLEIVYGKATNIIEEIREYEDEQKKFEDNPGSSNIFERFLINVYLKYSRLQLKIQKKHEEQNSNKCPDPKAYYTNNKLLLRLWSFAGSTTHITLCIVCAFFNNMELFLLICILPLNLLMLVLFFVQKKVNKILT
ncbi:MAG: CDP-alcohol phosphatidyltransferase family protein [Ignavibacteria bacterium]|nr:CDP-alcohol phosphatidyltransferase family protein [Ignavibacteria bacterium]MCC7159681.1 CDP-alcohol phosphatidyltransferase family protein [Ignavibacteria bacterium]